MKTPPSEAGFSVLEAIIAVAILAIALIPLLQLQSQFVRSVDSFERAEIRVAVRQEALHSLQSINFSLFPTGEERLGSHAMRWTTQPAKTSEKTEIAPRQAGRYTLILYDVSVSLHKIGDARPSDSFIMTGLGWEPDQSFEAGLF